MGCSPTVKLNSITLAKINIHDEEIVFSIVLFSVLNAFAQKEDSIQIRRIADDILENGKAYDNLRVLCKTVGGRLAGSPQMHKAEAWGVKTLQQSGADKVWLQECKVPHWVRGGKEEVYFTVAGKKTVLDVLALGNSLGNGPKGILHR